MADDIDLVIRSNGVGSSKGLQPMTDAGMASVMAHAVPLAGTW